MSDLRCDLCGDVIGVYEPVIVVAEGEVRETSMVVEPTLREAPGQRHHRACFLDAPDQPG